MQEHFEGAKAELCLDSIRPAGEAGIMEERMETSIIALGEIG